MRKGGRRDATIIQGKRGNEGEGGIYYENSQAVEE